jgi:microsomal triglyceride transfer protein large subunit
LALKYQDNRPELVEKKSIFDDYKNSVFYAEWQQGVIPKVWHTNDLKDDSIENFQKALVSLFQYQLLDSESVENDVSGNCDVFYISKSSSKYEKHKTKCRFEDSILQERQDEPLGVDVKSNKVTYYTVVPDGTPDTVQSTEYHRVKINAYPDIGSVVESQILLKFDGRISDITPFKGDTIEKVEGLLENFNEQDLLPKLSQHSYSEPGDLVKLVKEYKNDLADDNIGKHESASALLKLLQASRTTTTDKFLRILKAQSTQSIKFQLVDLLAATQTVESHEAFKKTFDFSDKENFDYIESYFQSLAVGTQPKEKVLEDLLNTFASNQMEDESVKQSLVQAITAMGQRFAGLSGNSYKSKIVEKITKALLDGLNKCTTTDCKIVYLRGFGNLRAPATIETLLEYSTANPYALSVAAMKSIKKFPTVHWNQPNIKKKFENIFYQRFSKFDSSARTIALDILLDLNPRREELRELLEFLKSNDKSFEVKQYLIQKLRLISEKCGKMRKTLKMIGNEEPSLFNWNVYGGQKGLSTVLARDFSGYPSFNGSILSVQEMNGGVLKRGTVDLFVGFQDKKFSIFTVSFSIFNCINYH